MEDILQNNKAGWSEYASTLLENSGEMARLIAEYNWELSPIGAIDQWPPILFHHVNTILNAPLPMVILWGAEFVCIYNDAYKTLLGETGKHPFILGKSTAEAYPESWDLIEPLLLKVRNEITSVTMEDLAVPMKKQGVIEISHWSFSYSPIKDGKDVKGIIVVCNEISGLIEVNKKTAESLNYRQALLEAQNNAIPDAVLFVDTQGKILSHNKNFQKIWDMPKEILKEKDDNKALLHAMSKVKNPEEFILKIKQYYLNRNKKAYDLIDFNDGRIIERYGNNIIGEDGKLYGWIWYFRDITEIQKAHEELNYQKLILETVTGNTDLSLFMMDENQYCVYMNEAAEKMTGFTLQELKGKQLHYFIHHKKPDGSFYPLEECPIDQALPSKRRTKGSEVFVHKDGNFYTVAFTASPIVIDGKPKGTVIEVRDTTEEKKKEQVLLESEERFRSLANDSPAFMFMADEETNTTFLNRQWLEFIGMDFEKAKGKGWADITHPDDIAPMMEVFTNAVKTHIPYQFEIRQRNKDGEYHWVLWKGIPRTGADGTYLGMMGVGIDVTENHKAIEALQESEDLFRNFSNNITNLAFMANGEGWIYWYNQRWYDYTGTTFKEMEGWGWQKVHHPDHVERVTNAYKEYLIKKEPFEVVFPLRSAQGNFRWFLTRVVPVKDNNNNVYRWIGTNTDIDDQIVAEEKIREREERFRLIADQIPQLVWIADSDGSTEWQNQRWREFFGEYYTQDEWVKVVHPDDIERTIATWNHSVKTGMPYEIEYRFIDKTINTYRWFLIKGVPIRDRDGKISKWFGTCTDINDQKNLESKLENLVTERTKQLQRSNEDLQQFAHVASHDLKEPVRKIRTFTSRLKDEFKNTLNEKAQSYLTRVEKSADRMTSMIDGVLLYSSMDAIQQSHEVINVNQLLEDITSELEVIITEKKAKILYKDLNNVTGSLILIYQLFYNLINNSLKFSKPGIPPEITITSKLIEKKKSGRFVEIKLQDNGIGFYPEESERIFQTFTRLNSKDKFEGTGLGLALCRKIIERHNGTIKASGEINKGALFTITLPVFK